MYRNRCGVRLEAHTEPDREEAHNLFWARKQIAPPLAYLEGDPTWQAVVGLRTLLRILYFPVPAVPRPSCQHVAAAIREHCCRESGSHYLLFLGDGCHAMLESADACGVALVAVLGAVVESTNYILKKEYNGHSARGRGAGKSAVKGEAVVVQQVWEWWFLTFELPLLQYNTPHTAVCTAASLLSTTPKHPPPRRPLRPSFITLRQSMDAPELRKLLEEGQKPTPALMVCCVRVVVRVHIAFIIRRS